MADNPGPTFFDGAGNLYGTGSVGGLGDCGVVFKLTTVGGAWNESKILDLCSIGGATNPMGDLIFDSAGNLYGTTQTGGQFFSGTVFRLTPGPGGDWTGKVIYSFPHSRRRPGFRRA
jgi:uncharacterized repeat protein (TIGR03803 family)